jgi:hypothetical protein
MSRTINQLTNQLNKAQDEIIELKITFRHQLMEPISAMCITLHSHQIVAPPKLSVLLIGTSNVKNINEAKLTDSCYVTKIVKHTMKNTKSFIESHERHFDVLIPHTLTNDLKNLTPTKMCL